LAVARLKQVRILPGGYKLNIKYKQGDKTKCHKRKLEEEQKLEARGLREEKLVKIKFQKPK
jgi:hypothetical protein